MNQIQHCRIDTGDWVGSTWVSSPNWTPYGEAIAAHYPIQVPLFLTTLATLSNTPLDLTIPINVLTRPLLYDCLIWGMSAFQSPDVNTAGQTYLNISDQERGIPWVAPNTVGYAPLPAFAGMTSNSAFGGPFMFITRLPEMFFLPKHTQLKLEFLRSRLDVTPSVNVILTMLGVQLINHLGQTPKEIQMPNGDIIAVGSRMPWFGCVPFGGRRNDAGSRAFFDYELLRLQQTVSYFPPSDCNIEIHDTYASFLDSSFEIATNDGLFRTKIDDTRIREDWTPQFVPVDGVFGSMRNIPQQLPFTKPHLQFKDHKMLMVAQNNDSDTDVNDGTVTFRGVRRCEF